MDFGPDGSLCRITSSYKDCVNNVKIVKVSEEELLKSNGPPYKLVFLGEEESDSESSDEEPFEVKSLAIELSTPKNIEDKDNEKKTQEVIKENPHNKKVEHKQFYKRRQRKHKNRKRNNYNSSYPRNFKLPSNGTVAYNRPRNNASNNNISPWITPTAHHAYQRINPFAPVGETCLNAPVNSSMESFGLLGHSPSSGYPFLPHNFLPGNINNHFAPNQNRWNEDHFNNYQRSVQDPPAPVEQMFKKHNDYRAWKNRNRQKSWKRNPDESQKRRVNDGRFHY